MKLMGEVEIFGQVRFATVELKEQKTKGVTFVGGHVNRYKAYGYEDGKIQFYGYYKDEAEAARAARDRRNYAKEKRRGSVHVERVTSTGVTFDGRARNWRIKMTIRGKRENLGRYPTYGHAVLVRDVVARRIGQQAIVVDYEMPLAFVNDPVARSYITDPVRTVTQEQIDEYQRRVTALNRTAGMVQAPPLDRLPPEMWRIIRPS